jgi:hypothetical protein
MESKSTDYTWDVFLSYRRHRETRGWVENFYNKLEYWLSEDLSRPARIFRDDNEVEVAELPEDLRSAVCSSRCLLGIFSPYYFETSVCLWEVGSFLSRGRSLNRSDALIMPVQFHDGETFPVEINELQMEDVREYAVVTEAFWRSANAVRFEEVIKKISDRLAKMIKGAPEWRENFPVIQMKRNVLEIKDSIRITQHRL